LLVVTDGEDNASRHSLENTVEQAQRNDAVIYAVGVFSDDDIKHNHRAMKKARNALSELANATGGLAFFPENADDTEAICTQIAHDIRNQYTLAYYPTNAARDGSFRTVQVKCSSARHGKTQRAHAHRLLRLARSVLWKLSRPAFRLFGFDLFRI
jgi:Ca-activated chloride channel homolog